MNTVGTFLCVCNDGYELTLDGRLCTGKELPIFIFYTERNMCGLQYVPCIFLFSQMLMNVQ